MRSVRWQNTLFSMGSSWDLGLRSLGKGNGKGKERKREAMKGHRPLRSGYADKHIIKYMTRLSPCPAYLLITRFIQVRWIAAKCD
jgi:hypothetical protein